MTAGPWQENERTLPPTLRERSPVLARITLVMVSVLILTNLVAALMVAGFQVYHDGLIYPGVKVWGVDLGGMTPEEAGTALQGQFTYPTEATITFRDGDTTWPVTAGALGVRFDTERTVQAAYEVGRHPNLLFSLRQQAGAWRTGVEIAPVIVYDQTAADAFVQQIARQVDQPPVDASITIENLQAATTEAQIGRQVDVPATLEALGAMVIELESGEVPVSIYETEPQVVDVSDAARRVNRILAADLELYIEGAAPNDPGPWVASRQSLSEMLILRKVTLEDGFHQTYEVDIRTDQFVNFLQPLVPDLAVAPIEARLIFNDDTDELEPLTPSQNGRQLNIEASVERILDMIDSPNHQIPLVFDVIQPEIRSDSTAEELGITEMVASATTYFAGSSQGRRANVAEAASRFNGVIIGPGEAFSFNEYLGDVSLDSGFEEAMIIYNGRTIEGVGGGVCQVSTTAFQAAFFAGFPILERYPHGYRVGYYEVGEGVGMDATVYSPFVDFRFQNDTPHYLLIETETNTSAATVTFRFYSTSDGRTVQKDGPYVTNKVEHGPTLYEINEAFSPGQIEQVDYAVDGADVRVNRTVYRNGQMLYQDTFFSQYIPWQAIYQVAPGDYRLELNRDE